MASNRGRGQRADGRLYQKGSVESPSPYSQPALDSGERTLIFPISTILRGSVKDNSAPNAAEMDEHLTPLDRMDQGGVPFIFGKVGTFGFAGLALRTTEQSGGKLPTCRPDGKLATLRT